MLHLSNNILMRIADTYPERVPAPQRQLRIGMGDRKLEIRIPECGPSIFGDRTLSSRAEPTRRSARSARWPGGSGHRPARTGARRPGSEQVEAAAPGYGGAARGDAQLAV